MISSKPTSLVAKTKSIMASIKFPDQEELNLMSGHAEKSPPIKKSRRSNFVTIASSPFKKIMSSPKQKSSEATVPQHQNSEIKSTDKPMTPRSYLSNKITDVLKTPSPERSSSSSDSMLTTPTSTPTKTLTYDSPDVGITCHTKVSETYGIMQNSHAASSNDTPHMAYLPEFLTVSSYEIPEKK